MRSKPLSRPIQNHQLMSHLSLMEHAYFHMMLQYAKRYKPLNQLYLHYCLILSMGLYVEYASLTESVQFEK
jgi:hypothetical protein